MSTRSKKGRNHAAVDNWLDSIGLYRKNVAYDETCLFRAVSEQLFGCQIHHERVRKDCVDYGRMYYDEFWHLLDADQWFDHLDLLEKHMVVCGNLEIQIISCKYNCDVIVYDALHQDVTNVTKRGFDNTLSLCLMQEDHYDVVHQKEHIQNAGFCQSLIYNILYENVFDIPNVQDIVRGMLYEKEFVSLSFAEINNNSDLKAEKASNCSDDDSLLIPTMNIAPFPFKVAKALDPTIYRNIEYDSWTEVRRELRLGDWYYGDDNLILGTRCILNLENDKTFECYIQEIIKDENKCVVYVTKLAEKRTVNYTDLSPENDAKPWPLPYRFTKNLTAASPVPPITSETKFLKTPKKRKDKRRAKSNSESQAKQQIEAFIGAPLQIHENQNQTEAPPETNLSQHNLLVTPEVASPLPKFSWDAPWANNPPEKCWPQTPNFGSNSFNVKPMVASAPVTPNVIPYHDNQMPFVYNYHVDNYATWTGNDVNHNQYVDVDDAKEKDEAQASSSPLAQAQVYAEQHYERPVREHPTLILPPPNSQPVEMYSPVINIQPGTPVIYTHEEMVVPAPQYQVYTPPVQYMSPTPYFYSPTIQTAWYPMDLNSQGFIFPTPVNQNVQSN